MSASHSYLPELLLIQYNSLITTPHTLNVTCMCVCVCVYVLYHTFHTVVMRNSLICSEMLVLSSVYADVAVGGVLLVALQCGNLLLLSELEHSAACYHYRDY
jgi:hypothetical protein